MIEKITIKYRQFIFRVEKENEATEAS